MIVIQRGVVAAINPSLSFKLGFLCAYNTVKTPAPSIIAISKRKIMSSSDGLPLKEVLKRLESFAPRWLAEPWDNVGLLIEPPQETNVKSMLLTNDLTEDVMDEAIALKVNLILSYHPPLFKPFKTVTNKQWKSRVLGKCLINNIGVYSPHTSYDSVVNGVNDWLADAFEYSGKRPILPCPSPPVRTTLDTSECGAGRFLALRGPLKISDAVQRVKQQLDTPNVHLALAKGVTLDSTVKTVALCAGSGSSVLAGVDADLLLTGEMSHHEVLDAVHRGSSVMLTWHSTSERGYLKRLQLQLNAPKVLANDVQIIISKKDVECMFTV